MKKQVLSTTKNYEPSTVDELLLDDTPKVNSFNFVTSDGIARAIAGASGEVPVVTESDNGKVLQAIYDEGGPAVEWADAPSGVPEYSAADDGKVLGVVADGADASLEWVDQQGGGSYTAGAGISLVGDTIAVKHDSTISEITAPTVYKTGDDARSAYSVLGNQNTYTAVKIRIGSVSDAATIAVNTTSDDISFCLPQITEDPGLNGQYVKMVLANPTDRSKYVVGTVKSTATIVQGYNASYQFYNAKIAPPLSWTGTLSTMFNWGQLGVDDLKDSNGYIDLYFVACGSDGTVLTTGTYGPTDNMFVLKLGVAPSTTLDAKAAVTLSSDTKTLCVANAVPGIDYSTRGKVLKSVYNNGAALEWADVDNTTGVLSGDGSVSDPYKLNYDSTLSTSVDVSRIAGGDNQSFNASSHTYTFMLTAEQAAALNAAKAANNNKFNIKLSFQSTPVLKLVSAGSYQCYLHVGHFMSSFSGVSVSLGTTDSSGVLVADLSNVEITTSSNFGANYFYDIWISTTSYGVSAPSSDYGTKLDFTSDGTTPIAANISVGEPETKLSVAAPVPAIAAGDAGKVLQVNAGGTGTQWTNYVPAEVVQALPANPTSGVLYIVTGA